VSLPPGLPEPTLALSIPDEGVTDGTICLRLPTEADLDGILPAFADPETREAGNLPNFGREDLLASLAFLPELAASGRLLPLVAVEIESGEIVGGGTLHHLDAERAIAEIGYWVLPHARGRGVAKRIARLVADHAFSLGVQRVEARVNLDNPASERVLERVGFSREGVMRSLPKLDGHRIDMTLYSLLPGE